MSLNLLCLTSALCAATVSQQAPQLEPLTELAAPYRSEGLPGGVLAVQHRGELAHLDAFGVTRAGSETPITPDTRFYIASTAKMFTAACVHLLAQQGKLSLEDTLASHVEELTDATPGVKLHHLLHHRSGIRDFYEMGLLLGWDVFAPPPRAEILQLLARQRDLNFSPGSDGAYSNSNYLLLALVVERASGQPFPEFAHDHLFEPLGMLHTAFAVPGEDADDVAIGHSGTKSALTPTPVRNQLVGAGGAWSTARDLLRFAQVFTDERWRSLGEALTRRAALEPDQWLHPVLGDYQAGTMAREFGSTRVTHHSGGYVGNSAELLHVADLQLTVVGLANRGDMNVSDLAFAAAAHMGLQPASSEPEARATSTPPAASRLARSHSNGSLVMLATRGADGVFQGLGLDLRLSAVDASTLRASRARFPLEIELDDDRGFALRSPGKAPRRYEAVTTSVPSTEDYEGFAGTYDSEELGGSIDLRATSSGLVLDDEGLAVPIAPFRALGRDVHVSPGRVMVLIEFERDAQGEVTNLILGTGRAQGLVFRRRG